MDFTRDEHQSLDNKIYNTNLDQMGKDDQTTLINQWINKNIVVEKRMFMSAR
jgi:hypothetical protein